MTATVRSLSRNLSNLLSKIEREEAVNTDAEPSAGCRGAFTVVQNTASPLLRALALRKYFDVVTKRDIGATVDELGSTDVVIDCDGEEARGVVPLRASSGR